MAVNVGLKVGVAVNVGVNVGVAVEVRVNVGEAVGVARGGMGVGLRLADGDELGLADGPGDAKPP